MPRRNKSGVAGVNMPGMSVCATQGRPRMGPIFGGTLMSGAKVAEFSRGIEEYGGTLYADTAQQPCIHPTFSAIVVLSLVQ